MDRGYPLWLYVKGKMNSQNNEDYNVICIGDSRAKAGFIPKVFNTENINAINLSVNGGTPIEGYYILKKYLLNHQKPPKYLLVSYTPSHLEKRECYWKRTVRFNFLNEDDYEEVASITDMINDETLEKDNYFNYKFYTSKYLPVNIMEFYKGMVMGKWKMNKEALSDLNSSKGHYYLGRAEKSSGLNIETSKAKFTPSRLLNIYLEKLFLLAKKHKIKVFWYTMPFNEASFLKTNPIFKKSYDEHIEKLSKKYHFIPLNTLYYLDDSNFGDPSHLYNGAKSVTIDIKNRFIQSLDSQGNL